MLTKYRPDEKSLRAPLQGAVVGGVIGAAAGNSNTAKRGAGIGAATGTLRGAGDAMQERERVVKNCLSYRGVPSPELKYTPSGIVYRGTEKG